jgi:hypothetical protein
MLALFIFMYAILGMQLFGGKFNFDEGVPRQNFDSLTWAFISVFQMLTEEGWDAIMYNGMRATSWYSCIYFVSWMILGVYVLLNMFLAIVLQNFEKDESRRRAQRSQVRIGNKSARSLESVLPETPEQPDAGDASSISCWTALFACRNRLASSKVSCYRMCSIPTQSDFHSLLDIAGIGGIYSFVSC